MPRLLPIAVLCLLASVSAAQPASEGLLVITLQPGAEVSVPLVRIQDVALLSGPAALRDKAGLLDLTELKTGSGEQMLTREQVTYRLLLAGVDRSAFRVAGPPHVAVRLKDGRLPETALVEAAREAMQKV